MKRYFFATVLLFCTFLLKSQQDGLSVFVRMGGGQHNLQFRPENGTTGQNPGFIADVAYSFFFAPNLGLGSGIGIQTFSSYATLTYMSSSLAIDSEYDRYEHRIYYNNWKETQKIWTIDIPLALSYRQEFGNKFGGLITAGAKISIPIKTSCETVGGDITTTGYYPQWNVELENLPQHNFTTYEEFPNSEIPLKAGTSIFADLGGFYRINETNEIYIGGYISYCLSDMSNNPNQDIYQEPLVYNGVLASNKIAYLSFFSAGIKVGVNFNLIKSKKEQETSKDQ